jgi:NADPH:quinone reductase-like Zn-dependent oxidoreductase
VAGAIAVCGRPVTRWSPGDRAGALVSGGGSAEYCAAPGGQCLPIPRGLDDVAAAGLPEAVCTVWTNVYDRGRLVPGALGARVFATDGTPAKCAACERLAAERAIDYRAEDFIAVLREVTEGRDVDVILDMVAGPSLGRNHEVLAVGGRLVLIGTMGGPVAGIDLRHRRLTVTGSTLRPRTVEEKSAIVRAVEESIWPLIARGIVRPVVDRTVPLARAADAHRALEAGAHIGKIIRTV